MWHILFNDGPAIKTFKQTVQIVPEKIFSKSTQINALSSVWYLSMWSKQIKTGKFAL